MTESTAARPDNTVATGDPGDETARRFRYQWTYASILCCMLLDELQDSSEIFCEHHEDVLIKHTDGTFSGVQIKTRASDQDVWKAGDEAVVGSCVRFVKLENEFPGVFLSFHFFTNHPIYSARNGKDIRHIFQSICANAKSPSNVLSPSVASFVNGVARKAGCTNEVASAALSKAVASDDLPKLADIEMRLITTLTQVWTRANECSYDSVVRAARFLVHECGRASSLAHQEVLPAYLPATPNPAASEMAARLDAKRIEGLK